MSRPPPNGVRAPLRRGPESTEAPTEAAVQVIALEMPTLSSADAVEPLTLQPELAPVGVDHHAVEPGEVAAAEEPLREPADRRHHRRLAAVGRVGERRAVAAVAVAERDHPRQIGPVDAVFSAPSPEKKSP